MDRKQLWSRYRASLLMVYCAVAFSLSSCFTAILRHTLTLWPVMFFRLSVAWVIIICSLVYKGLALEVAATFFRPEILVRSAINVTAVVLEIFVLSRLSLTQATVLMYTHPLFAAMLATVVLGEKFGATQMLLLLLAFTGLVINAQPWLDHGSSDGSETTTTTGSSTSSSSSSMLEDLLGTGAALAFAVVVAVLMVWIRLKLKDDSALIMVHHYLAIGTVFAFVVAMIVDSSAFISDALADWQTCALLLLIGILVASGELAGNLAVQGGDIGPVVAVRNVDIVLVFIWQPLILDEPVTWIGGLGAAIILVATTLLVFASVRNADDDDDGDGGDNAVRDQQHETEEHTIAEQGDAATLVGSVAVAPAPAQP